MLKQTYRKEKCYICHAWVFILVVTIIIMWCIADVKDMPGLLAFLKVNSWSVILFSSIIALVTAIIAVTKNRQTAREKNSLDFEQSYKNSDSIKEGMRVLSKTIARNSSLEIKQITAKKRSDLTDDEKEFIDSCSNILNEWERAANAVNHGLYDEHFLYKAYGTSVLRLYENFSCYIQVRQADSPRYYINFVMLVSSWQVRRGKEERQKGKFINEVKKQQKMLMASINNLNGQ